MSSINDLLSVMKTLRDPEQGCPWDRKQTVGSILPYTLEEIYELADAIEYGTASDLCDELGDLLFHVVFYARIMEEAGEFDFTGIIEGAVVKLKRRHPHIFDGNRDNVPQRQAGDWERIKTEERREYFKDGGGLMSGISRNMPALNVAGKIQKRAASVGFDWDRADQVLDKIQEELEEVRTALNPGVNKEQVMEEIGDLFFTGVNLARHTGVDPELALRQANDKFMQRFGFMEEALAGRGKELSDVSIDEMEALWQQSKKKP